MTSPFTSTNMNHPTHPTHTRTAPMQTPPSTTQMYHSNASEATLVEPPPAYRDRAPAQAGPARPRTVTPPPSSFLVRAINTLEAPSPFDADNAPPSTSSDAPSASKRQESRWERRRRDRNQRENGTEGRRSAGNYGRSRTGWTESSAALPSQSNFGTIAAKILSDFFEAPPSPLEPTEKQRRAGEDGVRGKLASGNWAGLRTHEEQDQQQQQDQAREQ